MKNYYKTFCGILMSTKYALRFVMKNSKENKNKQQQNETDTAQTARKTSGKYIVLRH